jgi:hypothetical protein
MAEVVGHCRTIGGSHCSLQLIEAKEVLPLCYCKRRKRVRDSGARAGAFFFLLRILDR